MNTPTKEIKAELHGLWDAAKLKGSKFFVSIRKGRRDFTLFSDNKQSCWIQSLTGKTTYNRVDLRTI